MISLTCGISSFSACMHSVFQTNQIRLLQQLAVVEKASFLRLEEGRNPFLPVIPTDCSDIFNQMRAVNHGKLLGRVHLTQLLIEDMVPTPSEPYYIFDVEDGENILGFAPEEAAKFLEDSGRRGLNVCEVIALALHTDVLSRHNVDAIACRYNRDAVPMVCLTYGAHPAPALYYRSLVSGAPMWGAASCQIG